MNAIGAGLDDEFEAMVKKAERSVANLKDAFETENQRNVETLRDLWEAARRAGCDPASIAAVFRISHDIKGQGATFGYELLSVAAGSLCRLISGPSAPAMPDRVKSLIEAHVAAIELVTKRKITGPGGQQGEELVSQLRRASSALAG